MAIAIAAAPSQPLSELNTTPLIDVLLVLLILFVITIPPATHALDMELPIHSDAYPPIEPLINTVTISADGQVAWNGQAVNQRELAGLLVATTRLPQEPALQFKPDADAAYSLTAQTIRTIKLSGVTAFGFVGNERFAEFGKPLLALPR